MSEHTPLTEAERDAVMQPWWEFARAEGWDSDADGLYWAAVDALAWALIDDSMDTADREPSKELREDARATAERMLAARTSTATADTGLRERVEALARSPIADQYRDEACRHAVAQPYADNRYVRLLDDLRAALDATPASTEDRADNEGTP